MGDVRRRCASRMRAGPRTAIWHDPCDSGWSRRRSDACTSPAGLQAPRRIIYDRPMRPPRTPRIGFVGLGIMGTPMSGHLVTQAARSPCSTSTCDVRPLVHQAGVTAASSPAELAACSDVVFPMLPDGRRAQVALGADGLVNGLAPGSLLVDTSSSQPWITAETAERWRPPAWRWSTPRSPAQWGAQAAELVFMVGGAARTWRAPVRCSRCSGAPCSTSVRSARDT
jgi:hypothetical protein